MRTLAPVYANPFSIFKDFEKEFNGLVGKPVVGGVDRRMESRETDHAWLLAFDLPGVKAKDLSIEVEDGILHLKGTRSNIFDSEVHGSPFTRQIRLPEDVDSDKIDAKLEDGVLALTLNKQEKAKPKKIEIKVQ